MNSPKFLLALFLAATACFAQQDSLLIGPGDLLNIQVFDTPEMAQHPRVTDSGDVNLMFVGKLHVGGLSPTDAGKTIERALIAQGYMRHPQVEVSVEQYATQNVSVVGQVHSPGAFPIRAPMSVVDVLALAGGISEAGDRHITIERHQTHEKISYYLSNKPDEALDTSVVVYPGDTVVVPKAGLIFLLGDVGRPGGYTMDNNDAKLTMLQMLALAGGTNHSAVPSHTTLIRKQPDGTYVQIPIPLSDMQKGKAPDMALKQDDIVYVPFSYLRSFIVNTPGVVASTSAAAIYHF